MNRVHVVLNKSAYTSGLFSFFTNLNVLNRMNYAISVCRKENTAQSFRPVSFVYPGGRLTIIQASGAANI